MLPFAHSMPVAGGIARGSSVASARARRAKAPAHQPARSVRRGGEVAPAPFASSMRHSTRVDAASTRGIERCERQAGRGPGGIERGERQDRARRAPGSSAARAPGNAEAQGAARESAGASTKSPPALHRRTALRRPSRHGIESAASAGRKFRRSGRGCRVRTAAVRVMGRASARPAARRGGRGERH